MRASEYQGLSLPIALASDYWLRPLQAGAPGTYRLGTSLIRTDGSTPSSSMIAAWCLLPTVPVVRLLEEEFDPALFTGKIVIVGQSNSAAKDLYATLL